MMTGPVLVTGAGGALGRAVALRLTNDASPVVAVDRSSDALHDLPPSVERRTGDLTDPQSTAELFAGIARDFGAPTVVVHTVGGFRPGTVAETDAAGYHAMVQVNLTAAWLVSHEAARHMHDVDGGALVHIGARHGVTATAGAAAYAVSKAALLHLVKVLDVELPRLRVNAIVPTLIDTPANRAALSPEDMRAAVTPEALAEIAAFLVGPTAAAIHGATIPV